LCGHHRRDIAMSPKVQVDILPLEISPEIKLSGIQRMGWNVEFSLRDDSVAVRKRFTGAFGRHLKAGRSIVDTANECNESLSGTQLIEFWLAQYYEGDGVLVGIKWVLATALVSGIGCHLVPVPDRKDEKRQETPKKCGADLQQDERCAEERDGPGRPTFRLLVRGENAERRGDEEPGKRRSLAERQQRRGGGFLHYQNIYKTYCYFSM
jgi:hypothetical protein